MNDIPGNENEIEMILECFQIFRFGTHGVEIAEFSATEILREINFRVCRSSKTTILILF